MDVPGVQAQPVPQDHALVAVDEELTRHRSEQVEEGEPQPK